MVGYKEACLDALVNAKDRCYRFSYLLSAACIGFHARKRKILSDRLSIFHIYVFYLILWLRFEDTSFRKIIWFQNRKWIPEYVDRTIPMEASWLLETILD